MNRKQLLLLTAVLMLIFGVGLRGAPQQMPEARVRVLLFGDSWAGNMWRYQSYQQVFDEFGYPEVLVDGTLAKTAGTAEIWAEAPSLKLLVDKLNDIESIDIVIMSLGGNDLLGNWHDDMDQQEEGKLFQDIKKDLDTIVKLILDVRPDIEILLTGYDYPNFVETVASDKAGAILQSWVRLGSLPTSQINFLTVLLEQQKAEIANEYENVYFVQGLGLMQYLYGYPNPPEQLGDGFGKEQVSFPGQTPPYYGPFPGGDINYPSPPEALGLNGSDPIHLSKAGYLAVARNQMQFYFMPKLRGIPTISIAADAQSNTGWLRSDGEIGWDSIRMGTEFDGASYSGLLAFDTSPIHNRALITRATITLTVAKQCCSENPFMSDALEAARVGIIADGTGISEIISSGGAGINAVEDAGKFYGSAREIGSRVRIELNETGLAGINKQGLTTLQIYFPKSNEAASWVSFYHGEDGNFQPKLEVYYAEPAFSGEDVLDPATQISGIPVITLIVILLIGLITLTAATIALIMVLRSLKNQG